jgi:ParB family chromosome partitioning protein
MPKRSPVNRLKGFFKISPKEAGAILEHMRSAWRHEELVPQPEGYILIPLERIKPPKNAIREELGNLRELKDSIKREGLLQPICVRPLDKEWRHFEPIMGIRRYFACRELGLERVPCVIRSTANEETIAILALEENNFRKDLTGMELCRAIQSLRARGHSLKSIAERAKLSRGDVSAYARIPTLPRAVRDAFFRGELSIGHVRLLLPLPERRMIELLERIRKEHLSVGGLKLLLALERGEAQVPEFLSGSEMKKLLGSKVSFSKRRGEVSLGVKGADEEELLGILRKIVGSAG